MLELIVFALVLVAAQTVGGFVMLSIIFSDKFAKYYAKKMVRMTNVIQEEMEENLFEN
jgi:hypothetical protein